jgi:hypothetical protein
MRRRKGDCEGAAPAVTRARSAAVAAAASGGKLKSESEEDIKTKGEAAGWGGPRGRAATGMFWWMPGPEWPPAGFSESEGERAQRERGLWSFAQHDF